MIKHKQKFGVTLAELMMTSSVITVIMAIGFVGFSESAKMQHTQSGAESVGYAIKESRYFSRAKGVKTYINLSVGANSFSVFAGDNAITEENRVDALSGKLSGDTQILINTCGGIIFNENGKPVDEDGNNMYSECTITIGYDGGPQKTVVIAGGTGNVDFR